MTNVVLVVMDTARAMDIRADSESFSTLSNLAATGTEFTQAFANAPWTLPSHASLFSGVHPSVHGAHAAHKQFDHEGTLAGILSSGAGYHTAAFSNNTWISGEFGFDRGFDEFVKTWQLFQDAVDFGDIAQVEATMKGKLFGVLRKFSGNPVKNVANLTYGQFFRKRTDDGAKRTNDLIRDRLDAWCDRDDPLFLFVNYLEPHLEYHPPKEIAERHLPDGVSYSEAMDVNQDAWAFITGEQAMSDRDFDALKALYRAEIEYLDGRLGELRQSFRQADLLEDTVFIITGDHGENIGDHGLMDHQYSLNQTLLHVPLIISGKGFETGNRVRKPVQLLDLFPTILEIADVDPSDAAGGGASLCTPDELPDNRPLFSEYVAPQPAIETLVERYDCRKDVEVYDRRLWAVQDKNLKLVEASDGSRWLYDLELDPDETTDLAGDRPDALERMSELLTDWRSSLPEITAREVGMDEQTKQHLEELGYLQ